MKNINKIVINNFTLYTKHNIHIRRVNSLYIVYVNNIIYLQQEIFKSTHMPPGQTPSDY